MHDKLYSKWSYVYNCEMKTRAGRYSSDAREIHHFNFVYEFTNICSFVYLHLFCIVLCRGYFINTDPLSIKKCVASSS